MTVATLAQHTKCATCQRYKDRCTCTSPELDSMIERATKPTLAQLYKQGIHAGVLKPTVPYPGTNA